MKRTALVLILVLLLSLVYIVPAVAAGPAHQAAAADLKGDVATIVPEHMVGEQPGAAHQSLAAMLKGAVADLVPGHVQP